MQRQPPPSRSLSSALLALCFFTSGTTASEYPTRDFLFGNWGGIRDTLQQRGLDLRVHYVTEPMVNVSGGEVEGGTYLHNIGVDLLFDLERAADLHGTTFLVKLSKRDGDSVSADFVAPSEGGNIFTVQEIYGGQVFKLANVQINTRLMGDRLDIALGRIVANDDFLRSPLYCQFVNNSFCGSPKPVFLQNPFTFSAYPTAQWGIRGRLDSPRRRWTVQAALYDGDPELKGGNPTSKNHNVHGDSWAFGDNGVVFAGEIHYHLNRDSESALPGIYKVGGYFMNGDFQDIGRAGNATVEGNAMVWALADQMLFREGSGDDQGLSAFGTYVYSLEDKVNQIDNYLGVGFVYKGLFPGRQRDTSGLAFSKGWFSQELKTARRAQGRAVQHDEAVIELNHRFELGRGVAFQPDLQYVVNPAGTKQIADALLIGARVSIQF
jgi:porin